MPIQHVDQLAQALHDSGVVNLDTKLSDVLKIGGVGELTPGSAVASGAVAWDGYVIVYKGLPAGVNELQNLANRSGRGPGG
jgi:hypothetical protein